MSSSESAQPIFWQADGHHLAEINVATAIADLDDPVMEPFMAALDKVNALAEASAGFVWWIAAGTVPTLEEGVARLEKLRHDGPSADAFGWDQLPA